jgi:hypothetical protein
MPIINDDKNTLMIRCTCHGHVLEITNDEYAMEDGVMPDFDISVWNQTPFPYSFRNRLRLIWRLLTFQTLNGGDVIVNENDAIRISDFLRRKVEENHFLLKKRNKEKQNDKKQT